MKKCFLNIIDGRIFTVSMFITSDGWEKFAAPILFAGLLSEVSDVEIGNAVKEAIGNFKEQVSDDYEAKPDLDRAAMNHGFTSYSQLFDKCLHASIEEVGAAYRLTPYARSLDRGIRGATPLDTELHSSISLADLGGVVKKCIALCR